MYINFKKTVLFIASLIMMLSNSTMAGDAQIVYSGELTQSTCTIQGGNTINIAFGATNIASLTEVGKEVNRKTSEVVFSNCPSNIYDMEFTGLSDPDLPGDMQLSSGSTATGIAIRPFLVIDPKYVGGGYTQKPKLIMPTSASMGNSFIPDANGQVLVTFGGSIVRTSQAKAPTAGQFSSVMNLTFKYK